jgi:hypothetical protein
LQYNECGTLTISAFSGTICGAAIDGLETESLEASGELTSSAYPGDAYTATLALECTGDNFTCATNGVLQAVASDAVQALPGSFNPSQNCELAGGQQAADVTAEGIHTFLYTYAPSPQDVNVCFRAEDISDGVGLGGEVIVTPTATGVSLTGVGLPSLGVPTVDGSGSACSSTTPNAVPGSHPIVSGGVAGMPVLFDAYSNATSTAWVCVQVGTSVNDRVVVPVTLPTVGSPGVSVGPGYSVTFYPDPGTPI